MVTALRNIIVALLFLSLLPFNSVAETEINVTLEDNVVILLDYSKGLDDVHLFYIRSNVQEGFKNTVKSNISIIAYGYGNSTINKTNLTYSDLREFLQSTPRQINDIPGRNNNGDNIYQAFNETKSILYNATGSKQIILISNGYIDGALSFKEELDNNSLKELVRDLKKNNITINLSQVLNDDTIQKENSIIRAYSDLSKEINTKIVVLNRSERLHFVNREIEESKQMEGERGDYSNELFDNNQTANVTDSMIYQNKEIYFSDNYKAVDFYQYWDGYNYIVIPIIRNEGVFDEQAMREIFRGKDAIKMVKSGDITEEAYLIKSNVISDLICGYYDFTDESEGFIADKLSNKLSEKREFKEPIRIIKKAGWIKVWSVPGLLISGECEILSRDELPEKIIDGGRYTLNLKNNYAYNGIVGDFKDYNDELIKMIDNRKDDLVWSVIYSPHAIYYQSKPLIESNNKQLSKLLYANYSENVSLAAKQNHSISKFNTAIQNANKSKEIAIRGIGYSNNKSPTISIAMNITAFIIVTILIKRKMKKRLDDNP